MKKNEWRSRRSGYSSEFLALENDAFAYCFLVLLSINSKSVPEKLSKSLFLLLEFNDAFMHITGVDIKAIENQIDTPDVEGINLN